MFEESEQMSYDENIEKMHDEYLILVEGYPTENQIISWEVEEWNLKEKLAEELGGFPDEYQVR